MKSNKLNFPYQFLQNMINHPDKIAITFIDDEKNEIEITYQDLMQKVNGIGNLILELTREGDPVLLLYSPGIEFITAFIACLYTSRLAIPAYPPINYAAISRLESIMDSASPTLILSESKILKSLSKLPYIKYLIFPFLKRKVLNAFDVPENFGLLFEKVSQMVATDTLRNSTANFDVSNIGRPAFIQYTSGTTAHPKGVIISHDNIADNLHLIREAFEIHSESKGFIWLPPYHDMGLIGGILVPLYHAFPVVLTSPINFIRNPRFWLDSVSKYRATISGGPNFAFELCCRRTSQEHLECLDLSSWEVAFCGAEPINAETMANFVEKFKPCGFRPQALLPCYGNAESTLIVSSVGFNDKLNLVKINRNLLSHGIIEFDNSNDNNTVEVVDCGKPLLNVKIASQETGEFLGENKIGEILISGNSVSSGYWNYPEKTNSVFKKQDDGLRYYHSGDLGFLSDGKLFITGRINDLLIIGGCNYFSHEIESVVNSCSTLVRSGFCIAYESRDAGTGQLNLAVEVKPASHSKYPDLVQHILIEINKRFRITVKAVILLKPHSISKTTSGKLQRNKTVRRITNNSDLILFQYDNQLDLDEIHPICTESLIRKRDKWVRKISVREIENTIIQFIKKNYSHVVNCKPRTKLESLGLDSIMYIKLLISLKQALSVEFDTSDIVIKKNYTIRMLAKEIAKLAQKQEKVYRLEQLPKVKELLARHAGLVVKKYDQLFMRAFGGPANSTIILDGKSYINFASYNYLGLSDDKDMKQFIKEAVDKYGSSVSASRLVAGNRDITECLEKELAQYIGFSDSIVFTAGYQTVISAITHLFGQGDLILYDELAHNSSLLGSLYSGASLQSFEHNNPESLEDKLKQSNSKYDKVLIITEGVFSMDGDIAPIDKIVALKKKYGCFLMVDEAHSIGVIGETGRGVIEYFNQSPEDIDIIIGTLSKAFASCGGFICAHKDLIKYIKFSAPGFVFSAGISPANSAAALYALRRIQQTPNLIKEMQDNADYFLRAVQVKCLDTGESKHTPIVPVIIRDSNKTLEVSYQLFCNGINAPPIISPGVTEEEARIRFFITALHQKEQLDYCVELLARLLDDRPGFV